VELERDHLDAGDGLIAVEAREERVSRRARGAAFRRKELDHDGHTDPVGHRHTRRHGGRSYEEPDEGKTSHGVVTYDLVRWLRYTGA
jgi:hypothetical protein